VEWAEEHDVPDDQIESVFEESTAIMEAYDSYYDRHEDKLANSKVLISEEPCYMEVPKFDAVLRTTVDSVIKNRKGIWVVEHKSTTDIPPANWRAVDPQTAIDLIVLGRGGKIQPDGIIFNYLLTERPKVPRVLQNGSAFYANTGSPPARRSSKEPRS